MAAVLTITDGTITADLLTNKTSWQLRAGGWIPSGIEHRQIRRESAYTEGSGIVASVARNVFETYKVALYGASHDAIAATLQNLSTLRREALQHQMTNWQSIPVYLSHKVTNETGTRYALVYDIQIAPNASLHDPIFNTDNAVREITIVVERDSYWGSTVPLAALGTALTIGAPQAPGTQSDATEQFLVNYRDASALTHLFNYDDSLTAFSSNLIATAAFEYFVVSGSTPALNDIVYFGSTDGPFPAFVLRIGTEGNYSVTLTWEIYTGSWTSGRVKEDSTFVFSGAPPKTRLVVIDDPTDWTTTVINGVTAYWARVRISAFTSWATSPANAGQVVYNPRDTYISIASDQIDGDVDAQALLRMIRYANTTLDIRYIAMGLKSRGLTTFLNRLNAGGDNTAAWSKTYGADTTAEVDPNSPSGNRATCTFATNQSLIARVTFTCVTGANIADMTGQYHAYLRVQQIGGSAGDISVRIRQNIGGEIATPTQKLKGVSNGIEIISLGMIDILTPRVMNGESNPAQIDIQIDASATSATPDVRIYDLILIPIDEWAMVAATHQTQSGVGLGTVNNAFDCDGGLLRWGSLKKLSDGAAPAAFWESRGNLPTLPPDKALRIYFLFAGYSTIYQSPNYLAVSIKVWTRERWEFLRGAE